MSNIIKIDNEQIASLSNVATELVALKERVKVAIENAKQKIPTDVKLLDVQSGDKIEQGVNDLLNKIDASFKPLKYKRLDGTRKLDALKTMFTTEEKDIENLIKSITFQSDWNAEKLRRKREQDAKKEAEMAQKNMFIDFEMQVKKHYIDFINNYFILSKNEFEREFYAMNTDEVVDFQNKTGSLNVDFYKEKIREDLKQNMFKFDVSIDELKQVHTRVLTDEIKPLFAKLAVDLFSEINTLVQFVPTRLEQLKTATDEVKKQEQELLAKKQQEEAIALKSMSDEVLQNESQEKKIEAIMDVATAEPSIELSNGASVKLKYYPQNHAELLKMIQYYIQNAYLNVDFETINKKFSFVRTFCDSHLNKGEVIEGVKYEEELKKRRTK